MTSTAGAPARRAVSFWVPIPRGTPLIRLLSLAAAIILLACSAERAPSTEGPRGVALVPDTQTVDGVLEMRHSADALERAPQWTIDSAPLVVFEGGDDPEFDLTNVYYPNMMSDGRAMMLTFRGVRVMLFGADGRPIRQLVRRGEGPGELGASSSPIQLPGDTLLVADGSNNRMNWITADSGVVKSMPLATQTSTSCHDPAGLLSGNRIVTFARCSHNQLAKDGSILPDLPLMTLGLDYGDADTLAMIPGYQKGFVEVRYNGRRSTEAMWYRLGRPPIVMAWGGELVTANAGDGMTITMRDAQGTVKERIVIDGPLRAVTQEMRDTVIARELASLEDQVFEGGQSATEESRRLAVEVPIVDSLAAFSRLVEGSDGQLWATEFRGPLDDTWRVTVFRRDGTIMGRLTVPIDRMPVWFGRDRVMVREIDEDGVVRFGVYGMVGRS